MFDAFGSIQLVCIFAYSIVVVVMFNKTMFNINMWLKHDIKVKHLRFNKFYKTYLIILNFSFSIISPCIAIIKPSILNNLCTPSSEETWLKEFNS